MFSMWFKYFSYWKNYIYIKCILYRFFMQNLVRKFTWFSNSCFLLCISLSCKQDSNLRDEYMLFICCSSFWNEIMNIKIRALSVCLFRNKQTADTEIGNAVWWIFGEKKYVKNFLNSCLYLIYSLFYMVY